MTPVLSATNVRVEFPGRRHGILARRSAPVCALDRVTLDVGAGESVGIVGESGSGKTTLGRLFAGIATPTSGHVLVEGGRASDPAVRGVVQMVFQDPYASLNPRRTVGAQIADALVVRREGKAADRRTRVGELLASVGLDPAVAGRYAASLSGGERQRIAIARALAARPRVLVCDEPVASLDLTVRAAVLELLAELRRSEKLSLVLITHDLGIVAPLTDRVAVLSRGRIVEQGVTADVFAAPADPYTASLLAAVPRVGHRVRPVLPGRAS